MSPPTAPNFSDTQRVTLAALARCIVHGAPPSTETIEQLVARCDARITPLPPHRRANLAVGISALGSRAAVMLAMGKPVRFAALSPAQQQTCFAAWGNSALAPIRSAHQAVRRLVLAMYYARPEVTAAIGYAGPLHLRTPQVAWEGPLPGEQRADEPVARGLMVLPGTLVPEAVPRGVIPGVAVDRDRHLTADVVVIGTGAGGAVTAARMAEAGYSVIMVESGAYMRRADFTEDEAETTERLYADGALRSTDDVSVSLLQGRSVGGSTTVNWMIMLRTPDYVLREWERDHGTYGLSAREMAPVFERIERELQTRTVPDDAHSPNNRIILDGARALGWRATSANINAHGCVRCGFCGHGCRHNAKQSALLTYVPRALTAGATLYANAHVTRIDVRERDSGTGTPPLKRVHARVANSDGDTPARMLTIDAPLVVIAGGAIETPALLQRSGLGGGGVGHWLRLHPTTAVTGMYDREIRASTGISLSTMCDEHIRWNGSDYGFWIECPPMHPSFSASATPGFGVEHAARMRQFQHMGSLIALTRDGADTTLSNGHVKVDRHGRTSIQYVLGKEDQRRVRASLVAAAQLHFAAGATKVETLHSNPVVMRAPRDVSQLQTAPLGPNRMALFSAHVNGSCRMGVDPQKSGTTPEGERHGVRGLYIADGSLLPTSLGVNPQETIMAVTTVLAERMAMRHVGLTKV